jgi:hypothetical protein
MVAIALRYFCHFGWGVCFTVLSLVSLLSDSTGFLNSTVTAVERVLKQMPYCLVESSMGKLLSDTVSTLVPFVHLVHVNWPSKTLR